MSAVKILIFWGINTSLTNFKMFVTETILSEMPLFNVQNLPQLKRSFRDSNFSSVHFCECCGWITFCHLMWRHLVFNFKWGLSSLSFCLKNHRNLLTFSQQSRLCIQLKFSQVTLLYLYCQFGLDWYYVDKKQFMILPISLLLNDVIIKDPFYTSC